MPTAKKPGIIIVAAHGFSLAGVSLPTGEYYMILVVDIGNTTVSFGGIEISDRNGYRVDFTTKLDTNCTWDTADYTIRLLKKLRLLGKETAEFSGIVISSVVPRVLDVVREALNSIFGLEPLVVTCESRLGLTLDVPEPQKLGRDRLADSAWAAANYPLPVVTADLGTATTFNVIKTGGVFCGGVIAAGMETGLKALGIHTAQLPKLELRAPEQVIGKNTEACMLSGAVIGTAALLDGIVTAIEQELGETVSFVITGGGAAYVDKLVRHPHSYDPNMILKGLAYLYQLNKAEN